MIRGKTSLDLALGNKTEVANSPEAHVAKHALVTHQSLSHKQLTSPRML